MIIRIALFICGLLISTYIPMTGKMLIPRSFEYFDADSLFFVTHWAPLVYGAVIFAGVVYAQFARCLCSIRAQATIHLFFLAIGALYLFVVDPYESIRNWSGPSQQYPRITLVLFMVRVLGPLLFVMSSSVVLLQHWYSGQCTTRPPDPYFLYGVFSFGSLVGLWLYPLYVEFAYSLQTQWVIWKIGFIALISVVAFCIWSFARISHHSTDESVLLDAWKRIRWVAFAAAPIILGSIIYAVRSSNTPLVGVFLLAVIRLSLVFAFVRQSTAWTLYVIGFIFCLSPFAYYFWMIRKLPNLPTLFAIGTALFCFSFLCYRALFRERPSAARLTEFYLYVSIGRFGNL